MDQSNKRVSTSRRKLFCQKLKNKKPIRTCERSKYAWHAVESLSQIHCSSQNTLPYCLPACHINTHATLMHARASSYPTLRKINVWNSCRCSQPSTISSVSASTIIYTMFLMCATSAKHYIHFVIIHLNLILLSVHICLSLLVVLFFVSRAFNK